MCLALNVPKLHLTMCMCVPLCPVSKEDEEKADVFAPSAPKKKQYQQVHVSLCLRLKSEHLQAHVLALSNLISYSRILTCVPSNTDKEEKEERAHTFALRIPKTHIRLLCASLCPRPKTEKEDTHVFALNIPKWHPRSVCVS